jgi:hypothetical protein
LGPYILLYIFFHILVQPFLISSSSSMFPLHTTLPVLLVSHIIEF